MTNDGSHGFLGDGVDGFVHGGRELFDEVPHELRNISFPFAERWQGDRENIQPVVQIFAEFIVSDHLPQVLVGRRDDANIDPRGTRASYGLELALLEHTEQLGLKLQRQVSDFIEKQRATIRQCKPADVRSEGASESSPFMSEQLAFEKTCRHSRAVHLDHIPAAARAELVNRSRDDLLAGPGLAGDQDGSVRGCYGLNLREDCAQTAVASHDRLQETGLRAFWLAHSWFIRNIESAG